MNRQGAFLVALAVVLTLGTIALWTPLSIDQAIFTYGGRTIASGETLYVDFWDVKPPGVFFFYAAAGLLFGFDEPGLHFFELAWMLAAAALLVWMALAAGMRPAGAAVAAIAAIGGYLISAGPEHRTQVEALMALPALLALAAAARLARSPGAAGWSFALGAAAGAIAVFKPVYLPLPAVFALLAAGSAARREGRAAWRYLPRAALFGGLGLLAVWLPVLAHFAAHGAVGELLWTTFLYPREALAQGATRAPLSRLGDGLRWTGGVWWPWLPLVALGLSPPRGRGEPVLRWGALIYLAVAAGLIGVQTISWWPYHFVLLFPPLGLLAGLGLERLLGGFAGRGRRLGAVAALALVAVPAAALAFRSGATLARIGAVGGVDADPPLAVRLEAHYLKLWEGTRFLREGGRPGEIFVFGDQRILLLSQRRQAIAVHGHSWALFPESFMERLPAELMDAAPTYVYVSPYNRTVLESRAPELAEFLDRRYVPSRRIGRGELLELVP